MLPSLKVTALKGSSSVNDDDTGVRYTGSWQRNRGKELVPETQDLAVTIGDTSVGTKAPGAAQTAGTEAVASKGNALSSNGCRQRVCE